MIVKKKPNIRLFTISPICENFPSLVTILIIYKKRVLKHRNISIFCTVSQKVEFSFY